MVLWTKGR